MRINKQTWSGLAALAVAASSVLAVSILTANAVGTLAGAATVKAAGGATDLTSGNSATHFTLRLPSGAACAGDSANDGYRVQSYIVPASVDPATLTFDSAGPTPQDVGTNLRQPMYGVFGSPFVDFNTAPATPPPGPGVIVNIPDFDYAVYSPGDIPPGVYNVGIACTLGPPGPTQLSKFWNVQITFTTNPDGGPAEVDWTVVGQPTTTTEPSTTTSTTGLSTTTTTEPSTTTSEPSTTTTSEPSTTTTSEPSTTTTEPSTTTTTAPSTTTTAGPSTTTTTILQVTTTVPPTTTTVPQVTTTTVPQVTTTVPPTTTTTILQVTTTVPQVTTTISPTTTTVAPPLSPLCGLLRFLAQLPVIGPVFAFLAALFGCPPV